MDNSPESPQIDSSVQVAKSLQYLTIQQSPTLKSFNGRFVETEAEEHAEVFPSDEVIHDHSKLFLNGLKKTIEMEWSPVAPTLDGLSLLKEYNACDQSELTTGGSLTGKAYVEIEDRAPIDHSPNWSSLSREDYVPDGKDFTPNRSLSEKIVVEMEKVPNNLKPSGLSPSKEDVREHDGLNPSELPSEKAIVEADGRTEIYPIPSMSLSSEVALPFMKESSMWEIVDSMEVFRTTPQKPHFQPLEQYEVEFREGMAIGLMVTFANLVSSIQKLQISDSQDIFEEKLKALMPLELHGFNIQSARSCLEKLQEIRSNVFQSECKKGSLKERILETVDEKEQIDAHVAAHDKIIQELEENLHCYKERRTSMILGRNRKDSEIAQLKMDLQATEEAYSCAEEHFKAVANAPW